MVEIVVETLFVLPSAVVFPDDTQKTNSVVFIKLHNFLSPKGHTNKFLSMYAINGNVSYVSLSITYRLYNS